MRVSWGEADRSEWHVLDVGGLTEARRWAEARLTALGETHLIDALIVVGELLENAHRHAGGARQLRIHHNAAPCEVTVAVADTGTGEPRMRTPGLDGGRGLLLVDRLSRTWGVSHHDDGKLVWACVRC